MVDPTGRFWRGRQALVIDNRLQDRPRQIGFQANRSGRTLNCRCNEDCAGRIGSALRKAHRRSLLFHRVTSGPRLFRVRLLVALGESGVIGVSILGQQFFANRDAPLCVSQRVQTHHRLIQCGGRQFGLLSPMGCGDR